MLPNISIVMLLLKIFNINAVCIIIFCMNLLWIWQNKRVLFDTNLEHCSMVFCCLYCDVEANEGTRRHNQALQLNLRPHEITGIEYKIV